MTRDLGQILAAIDGALADDELPDAMRWSPEPDAVAVARAPFDGETVWVGPEEQSSTFDEVLDYDPALPIDARNFPRISAPRGGIRYVVGLDSPAPPPSPRLLAADQGSWLGRLAAGLNLPPAMLAGVTPTWDLYLVDPAHREEAEVAWQHAVEALSESISAAWGQVRPFLDRLGGQAAQAGLDAAEFVNAFVANVLAEQRRDRPLPPVPDLRRVDPRAYALQLQQSRGTGPDRQVQRQHRPRRHR